MQKIPTCPSCSHAFNVKESGRSQGSRLPLLLSCGHTFCENCLYLLAKLNKGFIECQTCEKQTKVTDGVNSLLPNNYMLGLLTRKRKPPLMLSTFSFVQSNGTGKQKMEIAKPPTTVKEICSECNLNQATCKCLRCECNMCTTCFDKIHSISKTLRKHQSVPLQGDSVPSGSSMCSEHMKPIEYFCEDDERAICSHCVIVGDHKQHTISSLEDKNKAAISEIEPAMALANQVYRKLKKSDKVLHGVLPAVKLEVSQQVEEIHSHFQNMHNLLQIREMQLIEELEENIRTELQPFEKLKAEIMEQKSKLDSLIMSAQQVMNNNTHVVVNTQEVLSKLNEAADIPCYITKPEHTSLIRFTLKPLKELTTEEVEDNDAEPDDLLTPSPSSTPDIILEDDSSSDIYCDIPSSRGTSEIGTISRPSSEASGPTVKHTRKQKPTLVRQETVYITHIRHPCDFFVQRCTDTDRLKTLARSMNKWCNSSVSQKFIPDHVEPDDLVLAKYSLDNNWYRARVRKVLSHNDDASDQDSDSINPNIEVYYIDYGNVEIVPLKRLRKMQKKFMKLSELAVQCSLCDIVPASETGEWTAEAIITFAKMTEDKPMGLTLMKKTEKVMMVDLCKPGIDDITDDGPVSIRDCLIFLELACLVSTHSVVPPGGPAPKPQRTFLNPELPPVGTEQEVLVSYITSPDSFFIQLIGEEAQYLSEIMVELQRTYSADDKDLRAVFCPQKDMICVAQYTDQSWYRAQVVALPGRKTVQVHYVDFGNTEMVTYLKLKKIVDSFIRLPAQAIHCKLADVEPTDKDKGWDPATLVWLAENLEFKQLVIKVIDVTDKTLVVQLLDQSSERDVCINSSLVSLGFASCTGPCSVPQYRKSPTKPAPEGVVSAAADSTTQFEDSGQLTVSKSNDSGISVTSHQFNDQSEVHSTEQTATATEAPPSVDKSKDPAYTHINVSFIKSPSCFYVQLATAEQDGLQELKSSLMDKYAVSEQSHIAWKQDDYCAARYSHDKKWYRAKVIQIVEDNVHVVMVDYGYEDTITAEHMRPLVDEFLPLPSFALRCHLVGIQAAGDKTKWSKTACEYLAEQVTGKDCYINIYNMEDGSLPVDLYVEEFVKGDALTADKFEYHNIAEKIVDMGLALPVRKKKATKNSEDSTVPMPDGATIVNTATTSSPQQTPETNQPIESKDSDTQNADRVITKDIDEKPSDKSNQHNTDVDSTKETDKSIAQEVVSSVETTSETQKNANEEKRPLTYLPPDVPSSAVLTVVPTYVDYHGVIYVQEIKEDDSVLEQLMNHLQEVCNSSEPEETSWELDQAVVAQFKEDDRWYRGTIVQINDKGIQVLYIDFGNCEYVTPDRLRSKVILIEIPAQCLKCCLHNVVPISEDGSWPIPLLEYMHETCVGQVCSIHIQEEPVYGEEVKVTLTLETGRELGDWICQTGMARVRGQEPVVTESDIIVENDDPSYNMEVPESVLYPKYDVMELKSKFESQYSTDDTYTVGDLIPVVVTHIEQPDLVYIQNIQMEDELAHPKRQQMEELLRISKEINSSEYPLLEDPKPGMPCIGKFTMDDQLYRAEVLDVVEGPDGTRDQVIVIYVDYGTSEVIKTSELRELPEEFLVLAPQCLWCHLNGISPPVASPTWTDESLKSMIAALQGKVLIARILSVGSPMQVELYDENCGLEMPALAYQCVIDNGFVHLENTVDWGDS